MCSPASGRSSARRWRGSRPTVLFTAAPDTALAMVRRSTRLSSCYEPVGRARCDEVLVPSNTYIATWLAVSAVGRLRDPQHRRRPRRCGRDARDVGDPASHAGCLRRSLPRAQGPAPGAATRRRGAEPADDAAPGAGGGMVRARAHRVSPVSRRSAPKDHPRRPQ